MSIRRAPHQTQYVLITNAAIRDAELSFKARGLLCLLLSMPDDWSVSDRWLAKQGPDGRDAVQSGLKELELAGYLQRTRTRGDRGQWEHESVVHETPWPGNPATGEPATDKPAIEEVPIDVVPTEQVPTEVQPIRARAPLAVVVSTVDFDTFWAHYPRKKGKGAARTAWDRATKKATPEEIIAGVSRYWREAEQVDEARFIAHPATWLNQERWLDEPDQDPTMTMLARIVAEERALFPQAELEAAIDPSLPADVIEVDGVRARLR